MAYTEKHELKVTPDEFAIFPKIIAPSFLQPSTNQSIEMVFLTHCLFSPPLEKNTLFTDLVIQQGSMCNKCRTKGGAVTVTVCSLDGKDCPELLFSSKCSQKSDPEAVIFKDRIYCFPAHIRTAKFIHPRELPTIISCWLQNQVPCTSAAEEKRRELFLFHCPPISYTCTLSRVLFFSLLFYFGPSDFLKCFCLCFHLLTNEPSHQRLVLLTVTSQTRAASPPSATKTCTTTRISGTCESLMAYITRVPFEVCLHYFKVFLSNVGPKQQAAFLCTFSPLFYQSYSFISALLCLSLHHTVFCPVLHFFILICFFKRKKNYNHQQPLSSTLKIKSVRKTLPNFSTSIPFAKQISTKHISTVSVLYGFHCGWTHGKTAINAGSLKCCV